MPCRRRFAFHREIGGGEHRYHAGDGPRRFGVHGEQARMRLLAQHRMRVQHAGELHVAGVPGGAAGLGPAVDGRPRAAQIAVGMTHGVRLSSPENSLTRDVAAP